MSDIEIQEIEIENTQAAQPGATDTAAIPDAQEPATAEPEPTQPAQEPQTATAQDDGIIRIMDPSGISLRAFSKDLIGDYSVKELTDDKHITTTELYDTARRHDKEPKLDSPVKGTYNFEYMQSAFKSLKALGQSYITIEIAKDGVICVSANKTDGMRGEWRFYLAPYIEQ